MSWRNDIELRRKYFKKYKELNKERLQKYNKDYNKRNKKKIRKYQKIWEKLNNLKHKTTANKYARKVREEWESWFTIQKLNYCKLCGYKECFASIDFHHLGKKKFGISYFISRHYPTIKYTKILLRELTKCIALCSNCHRKLHFDLKREGRDDQ